MHANSKSKIWLIWDLGPPCTTVMYILLLKEARDYFILRVQSFLSLLRALKSPRKSFELHAPLTFWVLDIFQASNQNLIMKYGLSESIFLQIGTLLPQLSSFRFSTDLHILV